MRRAVEHVFSTFWYSLCPLCLLSVLCGFKKTENKGIHNAVQPEKCQV